MTGSPLLFTEREPIYIVFKTCNVNWPIILVLAPYPFVQTHTHKKRWTKTLTEFRIRNSEIDVSREQRKISGTDTKRNRWKRAADCSTWGGNDPCSSSPKSFHKHLTAFQTVQPVQRQDPAFRAYEEQLVTWKHDELRERAHELKTQKGQIDSINNNNPIPRHAVARLSK
jgi:hypothetical protein